MSENMIPVIRGENRGKKLKSEISHSSKVQGTVIVQTKKNVLNSLHELFDKLTGKKVSLQLISAFNGDPEDGHRGKTGSPSYLEKCNTALPAAPVKEGEVQFQISFDWEEEIGVPGGFTIRNDHHGEFFLKSLTLEHVPDHGSIHFDCHSWVYPAKFYQKDRVFFSNKTYLPYNTPVPLRKYREEELENLRGDGKGELQEADRIYDYAYYNDLGDHKHVRPVLGGSLHLPYPRRVRTGRGPVDSAPCNERRLPLHKSLSIYVPRDERFSLSKNEDFLVSSFKALTQLIGPGLKSLFDKEFDSYKDALTLYKEGVKLPDGPLHASLEMLHMIFESGRKFPILFNSDVLMLGTADESAWSTDEEFAREMLASVNPVSIRRLEEFPPKSKLNHEQFGDQNSSITKEHIENKLHGMSIEEAIDKNKLFVLDYHDVLMPYIRLINETSTKVYASRTLLFLKEDGTLKPLAIELSLPHPEGDQFGAVSNVYTPAEHGIEGSIWKLAKAYVAVNDSGFHQLISHWLRTHAVIEPFVIATNRQLSVLHPVYKLLHPHFRDTLHINAIARQILLNAEGVLEATVFPGKYSMEMSSAVYKDWNFTDQALPEDLKKRGVAVEDENSPNGLRLMIEDYPFAVDGLEIWSAIKIWVNQYCSFYYKTNDMVRQDSELQTWWKEIQEKGHGDKKDEPWWPKMQTCDELMETCTITIWIASALHAALNFGQYPYTGYVPNRPATSRRLMPEKGSAEYKELESNFEEAFFKNIIAKPLALVGISLIEILSTHSPEEEYLGQRTPGWTSDAEPLEAFKKFQETVEGIGERILDRNRDTRLKNRTGPVQVPYTLLFPASEGGLTGKGIPNSISI